ncbi:hypothetical protein Taro_006880 [Colocasia esculenta]|uniref:X8 domain-containing protein n=1 Tax=Colocasia esculenta TaxID=4460 RepID=A0A843TSE9_COLES|nr:hypothetical protein [Colocasia esculenta]
MPDRKFEAFIFSLFNEVLKPGQTSKRNFRLFMAGMTPVYDIGILQTRNVGGGGRGEHRAAAAAASSAGAVMSWCLPKPNTDERSLQVNIDFACGQGLDCRPIQGGGSCFFPATVEAHAASVTPCWPCTFARRRLCHPAICSLPRRAVLQLPKYPERRSNSNYPSSPPTKKQQ